MTTHTETKSQTTTPLQRRSLIEMTTIKLDLWEPTLIRMKCQSNDSLSRQNPNRTKSQLYPYISNRDLNPNRSPAPWEQTVTVMSEPKWLSFCWDFVLEKNHAYARWQCISVSLGSLITSSANLRHSSYVTVAHCVMSNLVLFLISLFAN